MGRQFLYRLFVCSAGYFVLAALSGCTSNELSPKPPNIVVIMADDLGYSDVGSYGGEIQTPYIDLLAARGIRFTQFYNAGRCCPTRASLLTGLYPHQAGMGGMVSTVDSEPMVGAYQGYLNNQSVTMAEVLRLENYRTYMSGKWHVGEKQEHWPLKRGFDRYFGLISGASSYYELIKDQPRIRQIVLDDEHWEPPETGFYMTDAITSYATRFIRDHVAEYRRRVPFFLYVPYTAPHWPLHALPNDIERYRGVYDKGWDSLRTERFERIKNLGLIDRYAEIPPRSPSIPSWDMVENKETWARRMEVYAAMVDRMDQGIGRIIKALDETKSLRNTVILFLSDNGASPEDVINRGLHDSTKVSGSRGTYDAYREPWASVSNVPFRYYKAWAHEGGIATPLIAFWPNGITQTGRIEHQPGHVVDLMATIIELSGGHYPSVYNNETIIPLAGKSLVPLFKGEKREGHQSLFWEHLGRRAMRKGDWKIVTNKDNDDWELYNLDGDRNELVDLSNTYPKMLNQMKSEWEVWADSVGVFEND